METGSAKPKEADVAKTSEADDVKPKEAEGTKSKGRSENFNPLEDYLCAQAWVSSAENGLVGPDRKLKFFKEEMEEKLNLLKQQEIETWETVLKKAKENKYSDDHLAQVYKSKPFFPERSISSYYQRFLTFIAPRTMKYLAVEKAQGSKPKGFKDGKKWLKTCLMTFLGQEGQPSFDDYLPIADLLRGNPHYQEFCRAKADSRNLRIKGGKAQKRPLEEETIVDLVAGKGSNSSKKNRLETTIESKVIGEKTQNCVRRRLLETSLPTSPSNPPVDKTGYTLALLRALKYADVRFVRYLTVDIVNNLRCKIAPRDQLQRGLDLNNQIPFATVSLAGLPNYSDFMVEGTGMDARNVLCLQPDLSTFRILPYAKKSATLMGLLHDPKLGGNLSELCTRGLLQNVANRAKEEIGIDFCVGAEIEFCLHNAHNGKAVDNSKFCSTTTLNQQEDFIADLYNQLQDQEIPVETLHSEMAPGQLEVVIRYQDNPVRLVDMVYLTKETIRSVARAHSLRALFLPKIHALTAGNGLHLHLSFRDEFSGKNGFCSSFAPSTLSEQGQAFLEGILQHLPALVGLTMPTVNSFRRVGESCWTGYNIEWAAEDKEAPLRVCSNLKTQSWEHVEYKLCDSTCNLYLGLAAILHCGFFGLKSQLKLRKPRTETIEKVALPKSIDESLEYLEKDILLKTLLGDTLLQAYIALRKDEGKRSAKMSLESEVQEALENA